MFKITNKEKSTLELEIERVHNEMGGLEVNSEEYQKAIEHLSKLYSLKNEKKKLGISPDTIAIVAGNLLGIVLILKHEDLNVVTSKALGFVLKGRA